MDSRRIFFSHSIDAATGGDCSRHLAHAFCTAGSCTMLINGMEHTMLASDLLIVRNIGNVECVLPSEDFAVSVVYASPEFIALSTPPQSNYGSKGQMALYVNPVMHLTPEMQRTCRQDFDLMERPSA